jgi:hypothetical protein
VRSNERNLHPKTLYSEAREQMPSPKKTEKTCKTMRHKATPEKTMARINMDQEYPMESSKMIHARIIYRQKII